MADLPVKPSTDKGWTEPESAANVDSQPKYPYNNATQTESGHLFEMDDTPSRERVRLTHRTGTFIEMHPNGDEVHKVYGDGYEITIKNKNVLIEGHCNITINGDSIINVKGNKKELIEGNYDLVVKGKMVQAIGGKAHIVSEGNMVIGANDSSTGRLRIQTGSHLQLNGDLHIAGELTADKIYSETRVDAGTGMKAGILGFVTSGGLTVGLTPAVAIPGTIIATGSVNAGVAVNAPLGNFGTMTSILMTDIVNTSLYDTHIHPAPRGMTGTPISSMV